MVVDALVGPHAPGTIDKVVGIEARGFILAAPVAYHLGAGFVPMRKKGKLPYETFETSYALEYGSATIEVHRDAFAPGDRVLIVDDVLGHGRHGGGRARLGRASRCDDGRACRFCIELTALGGRAVLADGARTGGWFPRVARRPRPLRRLRVRRRSTPAAASSGR